MNAFNTSANTDYETLRAGVKEIYKLKVQGYTDKKYAKYFGITLNSFRQALEIDGVVKDTYDSAMEMRWKTHEHCCKAGVREDGLVDKEGRYHPTTI